MGLFDFFKRKKAPEPKAMQTPEPEEEKVPAFEVIRYRVKGVTFRNEDGSNRQTILRKIKRREPPFNKAKDVTLAEYDFKGSPALAVCVNGVQVGNVPQESVQYILDNWERIDKISAFEVDGGNRSKYTGETLKYGADLYIRYLNK